MRVAALVAVILIGGCARYEFDLIEPKQFARHIGPKTDTIIPIDPFEYRMRSVDNRLVIRIFNPSDDTILLLGENSTAVDPDGESHALRSQTIAPRSFIKLVLPPMRMRVYDPGPTFGLGVGYGVSQYYARDPWYFYPYPPPYNYYPAYDPWYYQRSYDYYSEPRYFYVYDDNDTRFWEWNGESEVRLNLVYARNPVTANAATTAPAPTVRHEFVFHRRKM